VHPEVVQHEEVHAEAMPAEHMSALVPTESKKRGADEAMITPKKKHKDRERGEYEGTPKIESTNFVQVDELMEYMESFKHSMKEMINQVKKDFETTLVSIMLRPLPRRRYKSPPPPPHTPSQLQPRRLTLNRRSR
jgi:hypothetical protein